MLIIDKRTIRKLIREYWHNLDELKDYARSRLKAGYCGKDYIRLEDQEYHIGYYSDNGDVLLTVYQFLQCPDDGWYNIILYYDCDEFRADVYDEHTMIRYAERYLKKSGLDIHEIASKFLVERKNTGGTCYIKSNNEFSKRINDGATLGTAVFDRTVMFHKTFITDNQIEKRTGQKFLRKDVNTGGKRIQG